MGEDIRHVLGISGGKDSSALAVFMANEHPELDIEYFFTDTGKELPEVYTYLRKLESYFGKEIVYLAAERNFDHWLLRHKNYLPSAQARWCTVNLKIRPFEKWVQPTLDAGGRVISYVAIRADENRTGYVPTNPAMETRFPLAEAGFDKEDVIRLLEDSGLGVPEYYKWRSRSGCSFCFYQQKIEWVRLKERHPDKFAEAKAYEKPDADDHSKFTWSEGESLTDLEKPERIKEIEEDFEQRLDRHKKRREKRRNPLLEGLNDEISIDDVYEVEESKAICISCHK